MYLSKAKTSDLIPKKVKCRKIITLGKCFHSYLLILGAASFKFFSLVLLGSNSLTKDGIGLFGFCPNFNNFNFLQSIVIYFGYSIFGIIFLFFKDIKTVETNEFDKINILRKSHIANEAKNSSKKNGAKLILLGLVFSLHIEIKKVLYKEGFQFFNFWTLEIIIILHVMKKYFIIDFYRHHKVAVIFITTVCSSLLIIGSLLPSSLLGEKTQNAYQNIKTKLGSYFYSILFIILFLVLSYIYSFTRVYSKILMQIKFISPYKIILIIGIIGFIISLIAFIVSYFIDYPDNFNNYFSTMRKVLKGEKSYKFWVEIFCVYPLYSFTSFMEFNFEIFTIYYLNPIYPLMTKIYIMA